MVRSTKILLSSDLLLTYILLVTLVNFSRILNVYFTILIDGDPSKCTFLGQFLEFFQF